MYINISMKFVLKFKIEFKDYQGFNRKASYFINN